MPEINMHDFEREIRQALKDFGEDIERGLDDILDDASAKLLGRLRTGKKHGGQTPEDTGEYAAGWEKQSEMRGVSRVYVILNTEKPQLTHLLEYGGQDVPAEPHIRPAIEETIAEITENL